MRKHLLLAAMVLLTATTGSFAEAAGIGMGYLAKEGAKVYTESDEPEIDETLRENFPLLAFDSASIWAPGRMSSEQQTDGRLHVRYWKNGRDASDGENTGWVVPEDVIRFKFDCCGEPGCSGIKAQIFRTRSYTDCFNMAASEAIEKQASKRENGNQDVEKLKLQLEIEKLKLEQEKLKQQSGAPAAGK